MALFVDEVRCRVEAGSGGHGCIAFLREKYRPNGGPCGGDGGRGGSVVLVVNPNLHTLLDFRNRPVFRAERGRHGLGSNCTGRSGPDLEVGVPPGTEVFAEDTGELLGDLTEPDQRLVVAVGGRGGRGNQHFATPTNQAPRRAEDGGVGERRTLRLTLKLIADVGLVGLPNAGKSTLLAALSAARPKIAAYPFTTLKPQLGIVQAGDYASFVMADIPGLIEGASGGKGLGHQFLRHIERTRVLLYMVDCTEPEPDRVLELLRGEVATHSPGLAEKPALVALTKADLLAPGEEPRGAARLDQAPLRISGHSGAGLKDLVARLWRLVQEQQRSEAADERPV